MSVQAYFIVAMLVAFYFGVHEIKQGDYPRATALLFCAAIWPVSAAFGAGLMAHSAWQGIVRICRNLNA